MKPHSKFYLFIKTWLLRFIVSIHLFFFTLLLFAPSSPKQSQKKRIIVKAKTVQYPLVIQNNMRQQQKKDNPSPKKGVVQSPPKVAITQSPKKSSLEPKQKPIQKQVKKPAPNLKITAPNNKKRGISQELIQELEHSLEKMNFDEKVTKKIDPKKNLEFLTAPPRFTSIDSIENINLEEGEDLKELLTLELRNSLYLPEYGEVKVDITFDKTGKIVAIKTSKTASKKNSEYLEKELLNHHIPTLASIWKSGTPSNREIETLTIIFCNDLN